MGYHNVNDTTCDEYFLMWQYISNHISSTVPIHMWYQNIGAVCDWCSVIMVR